VQNRTRRGFQCKWTKDFAALFVEEFVHCTIGGRIRTNDQQTTASQTSAHCCTIAGLFAEYGANDRISCLPHTLNLGNDRELLRRDSIVAQVGFPPGDPRNFDFLGFWPL
jgi:hypothetical protein